MESTRVTLVFTLPQTSEPSLAPRDRFWAELATAMQKRGYVVGPFADEYEDRIYNIFGEELKRRLANRVSADPADWRELRFEVVRIRYGSALLDLDLFGLGGFLKAAGVNEDFFVAMLERYAPDALVASAYGPNVTSAGTGLGASAQSRDLGVGLTRSKLFNALGASLLAPVILALLVSYVAFVEMHDEKVRYLDQSKVLMDHYQSEIDSLSKRLRADERLAGTDRVAFPPGGSGGNTPAGRGNQAPSDPPHTGLWIMLGDLLFVGALAALFFWGKKTSAKIVALLMALGGTAAHGLVHLEIKSFEVKVGSIFARNGSQGGGGQVDLPPVSKAVAALGPELLMNIEGFVKGESNRLAVQRKDENGLSVQPLREAKQNEIEDKVCRTWRDHYPRGKEKGMLLVVGGTDTLKLSGERGVRYESNFGLAQARAEAVKAMIVSCGVDEKNVLAMVFGPQHTPELAGKMPPKDGFAEDRRVQVWAMWAWPGTE